MGRMAAQHSKKTSFPIDYFSPGKTLSEPLFYPQMVKKRSIPCIKAC
jgi:hypothetical protein